MTFKFFFGCVKPVEGQPGLHESLPQKTKKWASKIAQMAKVFATQPQDLN